MHLLIGKIRGTQDSPGGDIVIKEQKQGDQIIQKIYQRDAKNPLVTGLFRLFDKMAGNKNLTVLAINMSHSDSGADLRDLSNKLKNIRQPIHWKQNSAADTSLRNDVSDVVNTISLIADDPSPVPSEVKVYAESAEGVIEDRQFDISRKGAPPEPSESEEVLADRKQDASIAMQNNAAVNTPQTLDSLLLDKMPPVYHFGMRDPEKMKLAAEQQTSQVKDFIEGMKECERTGGKSGAIKGLASMLDDRVLKKLDSKAFEQIRMPLELLINQIRTEQSGGKSLGEVLKHFELSLDQLKNLDLLLMMNPGKSLPVASPKGIGEVARDWFHSFRSSMVDLRALRMQLNQSGENPSLSTVVQFQTMVETLAESGSPVASQEQLDVFARFIKLGYSDEVLPDAIVFALAQPLMALLRQYYSSPQSYSPRVRSAMDDLANRLVGLEWGS